MINSSSPHRWGNRDFESLNDWPSLECQLVELQIWQHASPTTLPGSVFTTKTEKGYSILSVIREVYSVCTVVFAETPETAVGVRAVLRTSISFKGGILPSPRGGHYYSMSPVAFYSWPAPVHACSFSFCSKFHISEAMCILDICQSLGYSEVTDTGFQMNFYHLKIILAPLLAHSIVVLPNTIFVNHISTVEVFQGCLRSTFYSTLLLTGYKCWVSVWVSQLNRSSDHFSTTALQTGQPDLLPLARVNQFKIQKQVKVLEMAVCVEWPAQIYFFPLVKRRQAAYCLNRLW